MDWTSAEPAPTARGGRKTAGGALAECQNAARSVTGRVRPDGSAVIRIVGAIAAPSSTSTGGGTLFVGRRPHT
jgi:hypothetical protein